MLLLTASNVIPPLATKCEGCCEVASLEVTKGSLMKSCPNSLDTHDGCIILYIHRIGSSHQVQTGNKQAHAYSNNKWVPPDLRDNGHTYPKQ